MRWQQAWSLDARLTDAMGVAPADKFITRIRITKTRKNENTKK